MEYGSPAVGRIVELPKDSQEELIPGRVYRFTYRIQAFLWQFIPAGIKKWLIERMIKVQEQSGILVTYWKCDTKARELTIEVMRPVAGENPMHVGLPWGVWAVVAIGATITAVLIGLRLALDGVARIDPIVAETIQQTSKNVFGVVACGLIAYGIYDLSKRG